MGSTFRSLTATLLVLAAAAGCDSSWRAPDADIDTEDSRRSTQSSTPPASTPPAAAASSIQATPAPPSRPAAVPGLAQPTAASAAVGSQPEIAIAPVAGDTATKPFPFAVTEGLETACGFPTLALPANSKVFAAGAYGGRKLDIQIDQSGHEATQIDVAVNHRGAPVVLMLGSYEPTIWNIGWSPGTRIVAVLISGYHRQTVTGLPASVPQQISTHDNKGPCGYFYVTAETASKLNAVARRAFGRPIDMVYPAKLGRVVVGQPLGSGVALVTDRRSKPPESMRSPDTPLAGPAGLDQAVRQGLMREATSADANAWLVASAANSDTPPIAGGQPAGRITMHNGYVVLKPLVLPAGLYGAHSATFFVPKGVPRPTGNPGHSTIYDFNTLSCAGVQCRAD